MIWHSNPVDGQYISFSSAELYNTCPFKYEQQYLFKKWGPANIYVVIGICLHNIVECAYVTNEFDPDYWAIKLKKMFREVAEDKLPELLTAAKKSEYNFCFNKTHYLMEATFRLIKQHNLGIPIDPKFIETKLKGMLFGWKVGGKSDLIIPDPNPEYAGYQILLDIKSSQKESELHHFQTLLYREMAPKSFKIKRVGILYPALNRLVISKEEYRMEAAKYLKQAIDGLTKREFPAVRNAYCQYCHLKEPCPKYKCRPRKKK